MTRHHARVLALPRAALGMAGGYVRVPFRGHQTQVLNQAVNGILAEEVSGGLTGVFAPHNRPPALASCCSGSIEGVDICAQILVVGSCVLVGARSTQVIVATVSVIEIH